MERQGLMKKNLAVILALVMIFTMFIPAATGRAYAAQDAVVSIDGKSLNDGTNDVGGGTAVLNKAEGTLTLKDVKSEDGLLIVCQEKKFTVTVEGTTSMGSKDAQISGAAIWSDTPELAIIIAEGASLSVYANDANAIYAYNGNLLTHMSSSSEYAHIRYDAQGLPVHIQYKKGSSAPEEYYYMFNAQGDVVALVDGTGKVVVEYSYDAWGQPLTITGSMKDTLGKANPLRYRCYVYDEETGLYYLGSR